MLTSNKVSVISHGDFAASKTDSGGQKQKAIFLDVRPINNKPSENIVYSSIGPVLQVLQILGTLPLRITETGQVLVSIASPITLYSALVFSFLVAYVVYVSTNRVNIVKTAEGRFEEAVIAYLFTIYLFPTIFIPILWYETKKVAGVLSSWREFEKHYLAVCNQNLQLNLRKKAIVLSVLIPTISVTSVLITHETMVHFKILQVLPYMFLEILTNTLGTYWYLLCGMLSKSATLLANDFQKALKHIGPASSVAEYRALWLRLSRLARQTGVANCYTFTFINFHLFLIITLSIYGLMSQISDGFGIKDIGLVVTACCNVCLLFFVCNGAHHASHNVRTNFQKKLLMVELSWMNSDAQTEVNMFLRATEMNPSAISLGGFFDVNRNLFKSLLATMVTYLVVLLQFQISIPEESSSIASSTNNTITINTTLT